MTKRKGKVIRMRKIDKRKNVDSKRGGGSGIVSKTNNPSKSKKKYKYQ